MSTIDITFGKQEEIKQFEIPVLTLMKLQISQLAVIKTFLMNLETDSWLVEAENKVLNG